MAEPAQAGPTKDSAKSSSPATLRERYHIQPGSPLADLSLPSAQAFITEDRRNSSRQLFALIGQPDLPPRANVMRSLKGVQAVGLTTLVDFGPVFWPPVGRRCMAIVYERPLGGRVMGSLKADFKRIDEYDVNKRVMIPLVNAVKELTQRGITHRAIRPTNLYWMDAERDQIVMGDCVTTPPAFDQPVLFEPIEMAMATPAGRGSGTYADDLYSLGVTLLILLLGRNPVAALDDATIMRRKIVEGSYALLVGDERLPLSVTEVLRGLLCDDADERWTLESLDLWLSGRRLSPLQPKLEKRAQRGFQMGSAEYTSTRELAIAFAREWDAAIPLVLEGKLELWLRRALEDKERAATVGDSVRIVITAPGDKKVLSDIMMARVCILLDHAAPVRYKGFSAMPDGYGAAMAVMVARSQDPRMLAESITREIPKLWFEARPKYHPENSIMDASFREVRGWLSSMAMGQGIERCLYEMNEALPCQSRLIADDYVVDIKELLAALDAAAAKRADPKSWPVDRHVAAFIATRFNYDTSRQIAAMNESNQARATLGMINLLAVVQWRLGPEALYGLASWIGGLVGPIINSYHNHERRASLEKEVPRLVRKGSLIELYNLLDNAEERQKDADGFAWAEADYAAAEREIKTLEDNREGQSDEAIRTGQQMAALASVFIALFTITILAIMRAL